MAETRAVAKAILVAGDKILVLKRSADDTRRPLQWDLPGGAIDPGEDVKQACAREVQEEAGIMLAPNDFKTIYAMTEPLSETLSATFIFFRANCEQTDVLLSSEHIQSRWVTLEQAPELFTYKRHLKVLSYIKQHGLLTAEASD